jgi:hypothetical protein
MSSPDGETKRPTEQLGQLVELLVVGDPDAADRHFLGADQADELVDARVGEPAGAGDQRPHVGFQPQPDGTVLWGLHLDSAALRRLRDS